MVNNYHRYDKMDNLDLTLQYGTSRIFKKWTELDD